MYAARIVMTANSRLDRRCLSWKRGSRRRRGWDRQVQDLIGTEQPGARQECPGSADIEGLGEVEKFLPGRVYASNKHGNLNMDPGGTPALSGGEAHSFFLKTRVWEHNFPAPRASTSGLVPGHRSTQIAINERDICLFMLLTILHLRLNGKRRNSFSTAEFPIVDISFLYMCKIGPIYH
jgi:hypothetical protein